MLSVPATKLIPSLKSNQSQVKSHVLQVFRNRDMALTAIAKELKDATTQDVTIEPGECGTRTPRWYI